MLWNIAINDAGAEYDPLTLLRTRTMFGRPDWKAIYPRIRQAIETGQYLPGSQSQLGTTVGTYFCGVCLYCVIFFRTKILTILHSLLLWPRLSRKQLWPPARPTSTSPSPRSISKGSLLRLRSTCQTPYFLMLQCLLSCVYLFP